MKIGRTLAAIALATGLGATAESVSAGGPRPVRDASRNWAGYAVTHLVDGSSFTSVTATWRQPVVTCGPGDAGARAAIWIGLGGYRPGSRSLEQAGVSSDCSLWTNRPHYYAWYEIPPAGGVIVDGYPVQGGDAMTVTVDVNRARTHVSFELRNRTRGWQFRRAVPVRSPSVSSAEWIVEAPQSCRGMHCAWPRLADFGSVRLARIGTVGDGHAGTILDPHWQATAIRLTPSKLHAYVTGSRAGAAPMGLAADGSAFTLAWSRIAVEPPPRPAKRPNPLLAGPFRPAG
jgi:hypothetical protein